MFSQLGPLFRTTFRKAESNDTRQNIPHDERDKGRKKREEEEKKKEKQEFWEGTPSVTVEALRAFLINFLKTLPGAEDSSFIQNERITSTRPPEKIRPTNTRNAKAVRAYQSMASKTKTPKAPPPPSDKTKAVEPTADLLKSKELRDIHKLIENLDMLSSRGVQTLYIREADDFVESLKNAVHLEISKI